MGFPLMNFTKPTMVPPSAQGLIITKLSLVPTAFNNRPPLTHLHPTLGSANHRFRSPSAVCLHAYNHSIINSKPIIASNGVRYQYPIHVKASSLDILSTNVQEATETLDFIIAALEKFIPTNYSMLILCILFPALIAEDDKFLAILIVTTILLGSVERVPYSNRAHLVFYSNQFERFIGDRLWEKQKKKHIGSKKLYGQNDPETIRVQKVFVRILDAMHKGLGLDRRFFVHGVASQQVLGGSDGKVKAVDSATKVRNKRGYCRSWFEFGTKHLEGLNWELMLVKCDEVNAFCGPYGKIVVDEKFVNDRTDTEIAVVIGHEIGHYVARHHGESLMKAFWYLTLGAHLSWRNIVNEAILELTSDVLKIINLHFSRRNESEADYIGLMLMASAGYDPRAAPQFCKKLCNGESEVNIFTSTHPSGLERAKKLNEKEVMDKAVAVYEQVSAGQDVEVFI